VSLLAFKIHDNSLFVSRSDASASALPIVKLSLRNPNIPKKLVSAFTAAEFEEFKEYYSKLSTVELNSCRAAAEQLVDQMKLAATWFSLQGKTPDNIALAEEISRQSARLRNKLRSQGFTVAKQSGS